MKPSTSPYHQPPPEYLEIVATAYGEPPVLRSGDCYGSSLTVYDVGYWTPGMVEWNPITPMWATPRAAWNRCDGTG